ncbi:MAG TPA: DUF2207 domain-containing protein [Actinomycetota bacterium]|nr:DUF2207 domain-containing protein [Actinomycetota bacterium]
MRRFAWALSVAVASLSAVLLQSNVASAQVDTERIRSFHADIRIQENGTIEVVEVIEYDFANLERRGIFRNIPTRLGYDEKRDRIFPIEIRSVTASPGTPDQYDVVEESPTLQLRIGDPDRTITGVHRYTIRYEVERAMNAFSEHYELYWNAVGTDWEVPIERATVRLTAPAPIQRIACFVGPTGSTLPCSDDRFDGRVASFSHTDLNPFEGLTVVAALPVNSVVPRPSPLLEERWNFFRAFSVTRTTVALAGGLLLLLLAWVARVMWVNGRDRRAMGSPIDVSYGSTTGGEQAVPLLESGDHPVEYGPPDGLRPGQVGTLMDEVANPLDVTATIVDLAVRGYLRIEEIPKKWIFGKPDWRLVKLKGPDDELLRYEKLLMDGLFEEGDEVELSELKKKFVTRLKKVQEALYSDMVKRRWFPERPDKVRERWVLRGVLVLLLGAGLVWLAAWRTHYGLVPIPVVLAGLFMLLGANRMPRRTPKGTGMVRRVRGFRTYIERAEAQEMQFQERENLFSKYLPYAVVFGATEKWAAAFAGLDDRPPETNWYVGTQPFSMSSFGHSIDSFSTVSAGTIASTPGGSGSSGFGGGGSSGGGGGGGGGGSW